MSNNNIKPLIKPEYEQQPGESTVAYAAFQAYLDMEGERTLRGVAQDLHKTCTLLGGWSARWQWVERVKAWDKFKRRTMEEEQRKVAEAKAQEWAVREQAIREAEWKKGEELMAKADQMLKMPVIQQKKTTEEERDDQGRVVKIIHTTIVMPGRWDFGTAARMIEMASKLKRLAVGLNTDKTEHTGNITPIGTGNAQVVLYLPDNGMRQAGTTSPSAVFTPIKSPISRV